MTRSVRYVLDANAMDEDYFIPINVVARIASTDSDMEERLKGEMPRALQVYSELSPPKLVSMAMACLSNILRSPTHELHGLACYDVEKAFDSEMLWHILNDCPVGDMIRQFMSHEKPSTRIKEGYALDLIYTEIDEIARSIHDYDNPPHMADLQREVRMAGLEVVKVNTMGALANPDYERLPTYAAIELLKQRGANLLEIYHSQLIRALMRLVYDMARHAESSFAHKGISRNESCAFSPMRVDEYLAAQTGEYVYVVTFSD